MGPTDSIAVHEAPAWGAKADFLFLVDLAPWGLNGRLEQLWGRRIDDRLVELCCIPFFPYGIKLGDTVELQVLGDGGHYYDKVVTSSNRLNVRLVVEDLEKADRLTGILMAILEDARCHFEVFKPGYLAADVPSEASERFLLRELDPILTSGEVTIEKL